MDWRPGAVSAGMATPMALSPAPPRVQAETALICEEATAFEHKAEPGASTADRGALPGSESLSSEEQQSLWRALSQARHEIRALTPGQAARPENAGVLFYAGNPGQHLREHFGADGLRVESGYPRRDWSAVVHLADAGQPVAVRQDGAKLEYEYADGTVEWYHNTPAGIEHGYVLRAPRGTGAADHVTLQVAVDGLTVSKAESGLRMANAAGEAVLGYDKLVVRDATGRQLSAAMSPAPGGLRIDITAKGATYPLVVDPLITSLEAELRPEIPDSGDGAFGFAASLSGDTALISAYLDDDNGTGSGSAYVFTRSGVTWSPQAKLLASDGAAYDRFGFDVSVDGDTALVSALLDDDKGKSSGSAYVFVRQGTVWTQQAKLVADDGETYDFFGYAVSVQGDTALIGASSDGDPVAGSSAGSAYVYVRSGNVWTLQAKLLAGDAASGNGFGSDVSLSGETALIGANADLDHDGQYSGAAYVFTRSGSAWSQQAKLTSPSGSAIDRFGSSLSLSGETALVGAFKDGFDGTVSPGAAYVFVRDGSAWSQQAKLTPLPGVDSRNFGSPLSLAGDIALIAGSQDNGSGQRTGCADVFVRTAGVWAHGERIVLNDSPASDFGREVALSGDTALLATNGSALDAQGNVVSNMGSVYVLRLSLPAGDGDGDGASDAWETAHGFNAGATGDWMTRDSDGDGALDVLELFQGTDPANAGSSGGVRVTGYDADSKTMSMQYQRDTIAHAVRGIAQWSTDLVSWHVGGEIVDGRRVEFRETVLGTADNVETVQLQAVVTAGATPERLFVRLTLAPQE